MRRSFWYSLIPGFGHLHGGRWLWAIIWALTPALMILGGVFAVLLLGNGNRQVLAFKIGWGVFVISLCLFPFMGIHAAAMRRRFRKDRRWLRTGLSICCAAAATLGVLLQTAHSPYLLDRYSGISMYPTVWGWGVNLKAHRNAVTCPEFVLQHGAVVSLNAARAGLPKMRFQDREVIRIEKRIVGLPDETIALGPRANLVVNGRPYGEDTGRHGQAFLTHENGKREPVSIQRETSGTGESWLIAALPPDPDFHFEPDAREPARVDQSEIYVLGDNRIVSIDSSEFGPIPRNAVTSVEIYNLFNAGTPAVRPEDGAGITFHRFPGPLFPCRAEPE